MYFDANDASIEARIGDGSAIGYVSVSPTLLIPRTGIVFFLTTYIPVMQSENK